MLYADWSNMSVIVVIVVGMVPLLPLLPEGGVGEDNGGEVVVVIAASLLGSSAKAYLSWRENNK